MSTALRPYVEGYRELPAMPAWLRSIQDAALERAVQRGFPGCTG